MKIENINKTRIKIGMTWLACALILALTAAPAAAIYDFDGIPLDNVKHKTINGGVYVDGGHGLEYPDYTQDFTVPAGTIKYAKLYVGVWGGNEEYTGTIDTTFNGVNLGSKSLLGENDINTDVYVSGFGTYWVSYDVTDDATSGSNTATAITSGTIDGRIYGIVLVAVYEDDSQPQIEYWINEGNENPNDKTPKNTAATSFDGAIDTSNVGSATLWTSYIASKTGDADTLSMNGNLIATDAANGGAGSYFDVDEWDVTSIVTSSGNMLEFNRGTGTSLHPTIAVLVVSPEASTPSGEIDLIAGNITLPPYIYENTATTITATINNTGTGNAASFDATLHVDGTLVDTQSVSGLDADTGTIVSFSWNTPEIGSYLLEVNVDSDNQITESDETNNLNSITTDVVSKNGYFGEDLLTVYEHGKVNGEILYTLGTSEYKGSMGTDVTSEVESEITIPDGSSVKMARLYTYWSWSKDVTANVGVDPEMEVTFDGTTITRDKKYTDRKGFGSYDYPSGTYAYNVTDIVTETKNYSTVVKNTGIDKSFSLYGVGILVLLEDENGQEIEYWIAEGADMISATDTYGVTPEQATTYVGFDGAVDVNGIKNATLLSVVPGATDGDVDENELIFNTQSWIGELDAPTAKQQIAVDYREVGSYIQSSNNKVGLRDLGDGMTPSNFILILKTKPYAPDIADTEIAAGTMNDIGDKMTCDDLYGAAKGSLFFGIYDMFGQVIAKRAAPEVTIYGIDLDTDTSDWDWSKVRTTSEELNLELTDPMTDASQNHLTTVCYYDANGNGEEDECEETVYRTETYFDASFALMMEGGSYKVYASY